MKNAHCHLRTVDAKKSVWVQGVVKKDFGGRVSGSVVCEACRTRSFLIHILGQHSLSYLFNSLGQMRAGGQKARVLKNLSCLAEMIWHAKTTPGRCEVRGEKGKFSTKMIFLLLLTTQVALFMLENEIGFYSIDSLLLWTNCQLLF